MDGGDPHCLGPGEVSFEIVADEEGLLRREGQPHQGVPEEAGVGLHGAHFRGEHDGFEGIRNTQSREDVVNPQVEVRRDTDPETLGADCRESGGGPRQQPPAGGQGEVGEESIEACLEIPRHSLRSSSEQDLAHEVSPPVAFETGDLGGSSGGKGHGRRILEDLGEGGIEVWAGDARSKSRDHFGVGGGDRARRRKERSGGVAEQPPDRHGFSPACGPRR